MSGDWRRNRIRIPRASNLLMVHAKVAVLAMGAALVVTCTPSLGRIHASTPQVLVAPTWGALPTPLFHSDYSAVPSWSSAPGPRLYTDPAILTLKLSARLDLSITSAPVFRYGEPTFAEPNHFPPPPHATPESNT